MDGVAEEKTSGLAVVQVFSAGRSKQSDTTNSSVNRETAMVANLRMKLTPVLLSLLLFCNGCAFPLFNRNTSSVQLSALSYGITHRQVQRILKTKGELIFSFAESGNAYHCRTFFAIDTGFFYYLLWVNGELASIYHSENDRLRLVSAGHASGKTLPHEDGFATLREPFAGSSATIDSVDFSVRIPFYEPEPLFGRRGELFMWSPVIILFLPVAITSAWWGNMVYSKMYRLRLGMSSAKILWTAGTPDQTLGDEDGYGIWIYRRRIFPTGSKTITVSVGMRDDTTVWIRYHYDAGEHYYYSRRMTGK